MIIYYVMLANGVSTIAVRPFNFMHYTLFVSLYPAHSIFGLGLLICAAILTLCLFFVPVLGALWTFYTRSQNTPFFGFALAVFLVAASACVLLDAEADAQIIFVSYGIIAMMPVAAVGLLRLWREAPETLRNRIVQACLHIFGLGAVLALSSRLLVEIGKAFGWKDIADANQVWLVWYVVAYGIAAYGTMHVCLRLERHYAPIIRPRGLRVMACAIPLVVTLGLIKTLGLVLPAAGHAVSGNQITTDSSKARGMTAALYRGLVWVRSHTNQCAILAVNNHSTQAHETDSKYFYYSAFAEREVFLESWSYTPIGAEGRQPYPQRLALNERAVAHGDPSALRQLARMGVSYVLIDKLHGGGAGEPASVSKLVFSNRALDVYRLEMPATPRSATAC
jgi:hypothetical protein